MSQRQYYLVLVERSDEGTYGASLPDVEGVFATVSTLSELLAHVEEALHLRFFDENGQRTEPLPPPRHFALTVACDA
ncbi:MAG TPA: type II toxin-antitoxin system HicB family antitoxin [Ktedonosporobacter sp.]|nr:type II toxin-antitoxin system HicB family antitoxin [Ktedonosporobacter sp.]